MFKNRFLAIAILFAVLLSLYVFAQGETLEGIAADSPAYMGYNACIDSCKNCAENCRFNAYRMAAEIDSNEELCKQLPEGMKEMCINRVYTARASAAKDSSLCEKISLEQEKSMCILNVQIEKAISSRDEAECSSVPDGLGNACIYAYNMRMEMEHKDIDSYKKQCKHKSSRIVSKIPIIILLAAVILIIVMAAKKRLNKKTSNAKPVKKKRV